MSKLSFSLCWSSIAQIGLPDGYYGRLSNTGSTLFEHEPSANRGSEIRLLRILTGLVDDDVKVEIVHTSVGDAPLFIAISYTRGDEKDCRFLRIDTKRLRVRSNCYYALRQARLYYAGEDVWIDSICINQSDVTEKSIQVRFMGDIYSKATLVLVSLGPHAEGCDRLFALAPSEEVACMRKSDDRIGKCDFQTIDIDPALGARCEKWIQSLEREAIIALYQGWSALFERPYWRRTWELQEMALA